MTPTNVITVTTYVDKQQRKTNNVSIGDRKRTRGRKAWSVVKQMYDFLRYHTTTAL